MKDAYTDFLETYSGQHCPSAKAQRAEIDRALNAVEKNADYWSLDLVRCFLNLMRSENNRALATAYSFDKLLHLSSSDLCSASRLLATFQRQTY